MTPNKPNKQNILIAGGAGYIGTFMVKRLIPTHYYPIILDDLSNGFTQNLLYGDFIQGDIGDANLVAQIITKHNIKDVIHFAGFASVKESVSLPQKYLTNNYEKAKTFFQVCAAQNVERVIYSSSCAVYGIPQNNPISEQTPLNPINPYGLSKKKAEAALAQIADSSPMRYVILRYFNVAGADFQARIGEMNAKNDRLIKIAAQTAAGKRDKIFINGNDYSTPDGTAIRDYIHVEDVAEAHLTTLNYLQSGAPSDTFNVGYGQGLSVRQIIDAMLKCSPTPFTVTNGQRREGDPPCLIADASKIKEKTGWNPLHNNIEKIIKSALQWELNLDRAD